MPWLLVGGAILAGAVLAVVGIGAVLPRDHVAARTVVLPAPPDAVWGALTDVAAYPRWRDDVKSVDLILLADGRPAWREHSRHGRITYAVTEARPDAALTTTITDRDLPFGGAWHFLLRPEGSGTRVLLTERGEVHNPLFRFLSRFVFGHTATIDAYLVALGRRFGADVTPQPATALVLDAAALAETPHGA